MAVERERDPHPLGPGPGRGRRDRPVAAQDRDRHLWHLREVRDADSQGPTESPALRRGLRRLQERALSRRGPPNAGLTPSPSGGSRSPSRPDASDAGAPGEPVPPAAAGAGPGHRHRRGRPAHQATGPLRPRPRTHPRARHAASGPHPHTAGAFGLGGGLVPLLALGVLGVVIYLIVTGAASSRLPVAVAMGLLLGGAVGNLADRVFRDPHRSRGGCRLHRPTVLAGVQRGRYGHHSWLRDVAAVGRPPVRRFRRRHPRRGG